jgi:hypothetical protein
MTTNPEAERLLQDYRRWIETRRFFGPPGAKNVLSQFMPSKEGKIPNGPMSPEMQAFHVSLIGTPKHRQIAFVAIYCRDWPEPAKKVAYDLNMSRATLYRVAHKTANELVTRTRVTASIYETNALRQNDRD